MTVLNTHFDHAPGGQGDAVKTASAGIILGQMQQLSGGPGLSGCLLLGDLNFQPVLEAKAGAALPHPAYALLSSSLADAWVAAHPPPAPWPQTYHGWRQSKACCIDYIFCSPDWTVLDCKPDGDAAQVEPAYPSDHFPVLAQLRLQQ